jgi:hypothetical protein
LRGLKAGIAHVGQPRGLGGDLGDGGAFGTLEHGDDHRLLGPGAGGGGLRGFIRARRSGVGLHRGRRLARHGYGLGDDRFDADGFQPRLSGDQRGTVTVTGLAPERFAAAEILGDGTRKRTRTFSELQ